MNVQRWLVAGLGNPGPGYELNRHNAGFLVADVLAARAGVRFRASKFRAATAEGRLAGQPVIIVKPMTFMNDSGAAVAGVAGYHRLTADSVAVIHDELDLPFRTIRLKRGGGDNGHNGLRSVTARLGTRDYYRIRVGIGRPPGRMDPAGYVLRNFSTVESRELAVVLERAADAVECLLASGLAAAQNAFHPSGSA
jgi:peptidyl-tRNA hydrolase, PTH1 family